MNFLKPDSPAMNFLSILADLIILNLLFVICSLPLVTFGAAYSAKYYVAMKIMRGEDTGTIIPFFKAFGRNFKQATVSWMIMLMAIALILLDWRWIIASGWSTTPFMYKFGVIAMSIFVWLITLTIFPTIARYEMKTREYFKAALIFVIIKFIPLILVTAFMLASVIACIWYSQWFPLIYVFCSTTTTFFLARIFIKQFDKLEKDRTSLAEVTGESLPSEEDEENGEESEEGEEGEGSAYAAIEKEDAAGNTSLAGAKMETKELEENLSKPDIPDESDIDTKSGNKLTRFIRREKKALKGMTRQQRVIHFVQYYLPTVIIVLLVIAGLSWYISDVYKDRMNVLSGGLINAQVSEEGRKYMTDGFLEWGGYDSKRTASLLDTDLNFKTGLDFQERFLDIAFRATLMTGTYDYLLMRADAVESYSTPDYLTDMSLLVDMDKFSKDDFYYYQATEKEKQQYDAEDGTIPLGIKLTDELEKKLGLNEQYDYYIAFAFSNGPSDLENEAKFLEYLYGK